MKTRIITLALLMFAGAASADEIRIATLAPPGSTWMKELDRTAADVAKATENRVTTKYYAGGVMGDEKQAIQKMKIKQLDGTGVTSVGLAMIVPSIRVLELPMLFESEKEMEYVVKRMWPYFKKKFEKKGYILAGRGEVGWLHFFSKKPVNTIADLKGSKLWMWQDDKVAQALYKELGFRGVPMGVPDVKSALGSGKINALYSSPLATVALQWNTKVKHATTLTPIYALSASIVRKDSWEKISEADRKTMKKIMATSRRRLVRNVRRDNKTALKQMKRKGMKVNKTPDAEVEKFRAASERVWQKLAGKVYSKGELKLVLKLRDKYRAKNKK